MQNRITSILIAVVAFAVTASAETVKLSGVHLCCKGCVRGVEGPAKKAGVKVAVDQKAKTVTLEGSLAALKKALAAIGDAGYTGKADGNLKVPALKAAKGKVASAKIAGVHLCCGSCVKAVNKALKGVPGVKANTAAKRTDVFEVTGNFEPQAVLNALAKAGLSARVGK
jgi:periplasmic mercuric ion binding protein